MRAPVRLLLFAAIPLAALCICVLVSADEGGFRGTAVGAWLRETRRGERLRTAGSDLLRSNESAHSILAALIEGRLSLPDAAERIRHERENRPYPFRMKPTPQPGESLDDYYLRFTIELVHWHLEGEERQSEVVQRLQQELQNYLAPPREYVPTEPDASDASTE